MASDFRYSIGTFSRILTTGNQVVPVSDLCGPFTPQGVILWTTSQPTVGFTDTGRFTFGMATGVVGRSQSSYKFDNSPSSAGRNNRGSFSDAILHASTASSTTVTDAAQIGAFANGSFTVSWTGNNGEAWLIHYFAFGGGDLQTAPMDFLLNPASPGTASVASLGIGQLTGLLLMQQYSTLGLVNTGVPVQSRDLSPCFSWTDGTGEGAVASNSIFVNTVGPPTNNYSWQRADRAVVGMDRDLSTTDATITALVNSGFTLDFATTYVGVYSGIGGGAGTYYIPFSGARMKVGSLTQPLTSGTQTTTLSWAPGAVLFMSAGQITTSGLIHDERFSFGGVAQQTQVCTWIGDKTGPFPSNATRGQFTDRVIQFADPAHTTATALASASCTLTSTGFTLDWVSDGTAREVLYCAFEGGSDANGNSCVLPVTPVPPTPTPPTIQRPQRRWFLHRFDATPRQEEHS